MRRAWALAADHRSRAGAAGDERPHDGRHGSPRRFPNVIERQPAGDDQLLGGAVAATTSREATPRPGETVLPAGQPRRIRSDVLDEEQLTVRSEDSRDLPQCDVRP